MSFKADVEIEAQRLIERANQKFNTNVTLDKITWYDKGQRAGWANIRAGKYLLGLSAEALEKFPEGTIAVTLPHEVAHLIIFCMKSQGRSRDKGHGRDWRIVDAFLGGNGKRCHSMKLTKARKVIRFKYVMDSGRSIEVSSVLHKKIQNGFDRRFRDTKEKICAHHYNGIVE